jgi:hypothetical protein
MSIHRGKLETCGTAAPVNCIAPFALTAGRFFGLDAGDWSVVLFGFALAAGLLALL